MKTIYNSSFSTAALAALATTSYTPTTVPYSTLHMSHIHKVVDDLLASVWQLCLTRDSRPHIDPRADLCQVLLLQRAGGKYVMVTTFDNL